MLRYHMAVVTRDTNLKRELKRVTAATASSADYLTDATGFDPDRPPQLAIFDARQTNPDKLFLGKVPQNAKIIYIVEGDSLTKKLNLLEDPRVTSLFCHDARFDDDEFIATATKALRGEVFGLQKYFPWGVTLFSMQVKSHAEKSRAIDVLMEYANAAGLRGAVRDRIQLVCDELMMNGLWHAPVGPDGKEKYAGKSLKDLAQLPSVDPIQVQYGSSGRYFGVSVRDSGGSFTRARLLEYLLKAKGSAGAQIETKTSGAGLGLVSVLRSVSKLVYHIDRGHSTEAVALFDMELFAKGKMGARSLHVFEAAVRPAAVREDTGGEADAEAGPRSTLANNPRAWAVAAVLLAIFSALATGLYMQRGSSASAASAPVAGAQRAATLIVFPDPADAVVTLDGQPIEARTPVPLTAGVLSVSKAGYTTSSIEITLPAEPRDRTVHVTLAPVAAPRKPGRPPP